MQNTRRIHIPPVLLVPLTIITIYMSTSNGNRKKSRTTCKPYCVIEWDIGPVLFWIQIVNSHQQYRLLRIIVQTSLCVDLVRKKYVYAFKFADLKKIFSPFNWYAYIIFLFSSLSELHYTKNWNKFIKNRLNLNWVKEMYSKNWLNKLILTSRYN